ncbi:MAG: hypothetical protein ACTHOD_15455 [Motilibacteraceae bacterium]
MQTDPTPPRRRLRAAALGAGWLAATAGVAAGAWLAVSAAGDGLGVGQRVLTADQVRARLADVEAADDQAGDPTGDAATPPTTAAGPTPAPTAGDRPDGGQDEPAITSPAGPDGSAGAGATAGGSTAGGSTSGGGSGGTRPGGTTSHPRPATSAAAAPVRTGAVAVSGGTAAVACQGPVVSLRYATPRDGWTVAVQDRGPEKVEVVFTRATGESGGGSGSGGSGEDHGGGGHEPEATAKATCVGGTPVWETEQH